MSRLYARPASYGEPITLAVIGLTTAAVGATRAATNAHAKAKARRETLSGLIGQRDKLQRKLARANGVQRRERLAQKLREIENKIAPLERALAVDEAVARAAEAEAIAANARINIDARQVSAQIEHQAQMQQFWSNTFPLYAGAGGVVLLLGIGLYAASR